MAEFDYRLDTEPRADKLRGFGLNAAAFMAGLVLWYLPVPSWLHVIAFLSMAGGGFMVCVYTKELWGRGWLCLVADLLGWWGYFAYIRPKVFANMINDAGWILAICQLALMAWLALAIMMIVRRLLGKEKPSY
jgi:hypothetical protein